ncbi:hypothetical protein ACP70R_019248 [Stipagrostis hirtigluma subsp. patula]
MSSLLICLAPLAVPGRFLISLNSTMKHIISLHGLLLLSSFISLLPSAAVPATAAGGRREAEALLKWKASLAGGGDESLSSWTLATNSTTSPCSWAFVGCSLAGDVTGLRVSNAGLNGTLAGLDFSAFPRLETLQLEGNGLYGTIPEGIANLTSLAFLRISVDHGVTGPIPRSIGQLKQLAELHLDSLGLNGTIPDEIGNLTSLQQLVLSSNSLTGSIPATVGRLQKLTWLGLDRNDLGGRIPLEVGNMTKLGILDLTQNSLIGFLPGTIADLRNLTMFLVSSNKLGGHITPQLGNMSSLQVVDIEMNNFSGMAAESICTGGALTQFTARNNGFTSLQSLNFQNCTSLMSLDFGANAILGDVRELIGTLPKQIQAIYNSQNQLYGTLPLELGDFGKLYDLELGENEITGEIPPTLGNLTSLMYLNLAHNLLTGTIPPEFHKLLEIVSLDLSYNHLPSSLLTLHLTLGNLSKLTSLDLSSCGLTGQAYDLFTHQSNSSSNITFPFIEILSLSSNYITDTMPMSLCYAKNLTILDLSNNALYGHLPDCLWGMLSLQFIDLSNNSFGGVVPLSRSTSPNIILQSLHLSNNRFEGNFPLVIRKCAKLIALDLGGNSFTGEIPSWISESLPQLRYLRLTSNMFDGVIPEQILQFHRLQLLDLSHNKLTGPIPVDFANFTGMKQDQEQEHGEIIYFYNHYETIQVVWKNGDHVYSKTIAFMMGIDLSYNSLTHVIPEGLTTLRGLKSLNLSRNRLSGAIPNGIGNLELLESLDLSWNCLEGEIPPSFANLKDISTLNLSNNGLSGRIPTGDQLQTLDDPSIYMNNPGLCGFPLKACADATSTQTEMSQEDDREALWLYCFVAAGVIFGFWLSWGVLFCNMTWRYAFYRYVDIMQEKVAKKISACRGSGPRP